MFRPELETVRIRFDNPDHPLYGLDMVCKMPTVQVVLESVAAMELYNVQERLRNLGGGSLDAQGVEQLIAELQKRTRQPYELFADQLIEWNVEDPNPPHEPLPPTVEGFAKLSRRMMNRIMREWRQYTGGLDDDLKDDSPSGDISRMESLPMEVG